jgi:segregation and condensation protein B
MRTPLEIELEAILFFRGEPTTLKKLAEYTGESVEEVKNAIQTLKVNLNNRGLVLVESGNEVMMGTAPEVSSLIEKVTKEELTRDLGRAGLETLAIILYKGKASKREIDNIRGVNSGFILRNLLIRGLVKREEQKGERGYIYMATVELLSFMGVTKHDELPEFENVKKELETFLNLPAQGEDTE